MAKTKELEYAEARVAELRKQIAPLDTELNVFEAAREKLYRRYVKDELFDSGIKMEETVCMLVDGSNNRRVLVCDVDEWGLVVVREFTKKGKPFKYSIRVALKDLRKI